VWCAPRRGAPATPRCGVWRRRPSTAATPRRRDGAPRRTAARDVARSAARRGSRGDALRRALCLAATACGALSRRRAAMVTNMFL